MYLATFCQPFIRTFVSPNEHSQRSNIMKSQTTISILAAAALALTSMSAVAQGRHGQGGAQPQDRAQVERGQKDFDRDRLRDRDRIIAPSPDRDRDQNRIHTPQTASRGNQGVYGSELMSVQERKQYHEQLMLTESDPKARTEFMAQHQEKMQVRAKAQGKILEDPPEVEEAE
jgi:hypothetical protein